MPDSTSKTTPTFWDLLPTDLGYIVIGLLSYFADLLNVQILLIKALSDFNERVWFGCIDCILYLSVGACLFIHDVKVGKAVLIILFHKFAHKFF